MRPKIEGQEKKDMLERGRKLREYRIANKIPQLKMAKKLGLKTQQMISFMEKNGITIENAIHFEKKLGIVLGPKNTVTPVLNLTTTNKIEATLKVLIHRLAKKDSKETGRPIEDCIKDIEDDIKLVMR